LLLAGYAKATGVITSSSCVFWGEFVSIDAMSCVAEFAVMRAVSDKIFVVLTVGTPFEVIGAVVQLVAIKVAACPSGWLWPVEGRCYNKVDERVITTA